MIQLSSHLCLLRQFLKSIYPDAVITMHYHGGELPGVLHSLGAQGRAFVEARYDIRRLNRELLATAMTYRDEREVAAQEIVY